MRRTTWALGLLAALAQPASAQTVSEDEAREGFISLFNGKDWTGLQFGGGYGLPAKVGANWLVKDGVIHITGGGGPHVGTQWDYDDFEFRLQWRAVKPTGGYNSGVYVRSGRKVGANQLNLAKGGEAVPVGFKLANAKKVTDLLKPQGEWNEWKIRCVGEKITLWCNDKLAWEADDFKAKKGHLGVQAEGAAMEFRNLRIQEIGWLNLNQAAAWKDFNAAGWKRVDDAVTAGDKPLTTARGDFKDYVLRLEWKAGAEDKGKIALRGAGSFAVGLAQPKDAKNKWVINPVGEWNYLEVTMKDGKATIWNNGSVVEKEIALPSGTPPTGPIELGGAGMQFRNIRVKTPG